MLKACESTLQLSHRYIALNHQHMLRTTPPALTHAMHPLLSCTCCMKGGVWQRAGLACGQRRTCCPACAIAARCSAAAEAVRAACSCRSRSVARAAASCAWRAAAASRRATSLHRTKAALSCCGGSCWSVKYKALLQVALLSARRPVYSIVKGSNAAQHVPCSRVIAFVGTHLSAAAQRFLSGRYFCSCRARNCAFSAAFASRSCEFPDSKAHSVTSVPAVSLQYASAHGPYCIADVQHRVQYIAQVQAAKTLVALCGTCSRRCSRVAFSAAARSNLAASSRLPASASTCTVLSMRTRSKAAIHMLQGGQLRHGNS